MAGRPELVAKASRGRGTGFPGPAGFTLVEVLVVIAIIAALMGLVAAMIPMAMKKKSQTQTQTLVTNIGAALELLAADNDQYGKYPPTRSKDLKILKVNMGKDIGMPNEVNVGIETIYILLNCHEVHVNQVTGDELFIQNTDDDRFRAARGIAGDNEAREYCDAWGQPLVYIHANDYKDPKGVVEIMNLMKEKITVRPKKMSTRAGGGYLCPNSFQLFSVGPNGQQDDDDAEESDDILYPGK